MALGIDAPAPETAILPPLAAEEDIEPSSTFTLIPKGRLFPLTFADPREVRTAVTFSGSAPIQAMIGSYLSLLGVTGADNGWNFHFGLEGRGYFTMRQEGGRFPLETVDGTLGIYFEYASGPWHSQLRYTHVSAHLADGLTGSSPIPYSRETLSLRGGYSPNKHSQIYLGIHRLVNTVPKVHPLALQLGGSYFFPTGLQTTPYFAADLRWQEETKVNPSFALQLGFALHQIPDHLRSFKLYYQYYTGADVRGQFYLGTTTSHSFGLELPL